MCNKKLTLTVGITTCYGSKSILDTVRSIRSSMGIGNFDFIIIADRTPIIFDIKKELKRLKVRLIENKKEGGQIEKQKQILKMTKTDIVVFTQDDVLFDPYTLSTVLNEFSENPGTTMVSTPYKPVVSSSFFESVLNVGTNVVNNSVGHWNNGDNYLSSIGRLMAFRTNMVKKFRMPNIAISDNYYYFENKKMGGIYKYVDNTKVYFKNPQNLNEHMRKSSRFQFSHLEMAHYFGDLSKEYSIPKRTLLRGIIHEFMSNPFYCFLYIFIFIYTRIQKLKPEHVLNPIWEVDLTTKNLV